MAQAAPLAPTPVFIVPNTVIVANTPAPEVRDHSPISSESVPAGNAQPPPNIVGPLRSRNHATEANINVQSAEVSQNRGPLKAIYQDSKTALFEGLPNSVASQLPWVNYGNRNEPFESVLARVSLDLQSANAADPEWALPAQNEIRRLALRLDRLPAPPNYVAGAQSAAVEAQLATNIRPFRPRPIWPGASANIETGVRPTSLTTTGVDEIGGAAAGENIIWQNLEPSESTTPATPRPSRRARR